MHTLADWVDLYLKSTLDQSADFRQISVKFKSVLYRNTFIRTFSVDFHQLDPQGTLFGGCLGPQFSTHFSIIKTEEMKDYSTQCCLNLWKNEKWLFSYEFNISFALIFRKWIISLYAYPINFYLQYTIRLYILHDFTFKLYFIFSKNVIN